jgi:WD40 repeat protein
MNDTDITPKPHPESDNDPTDQTLVGPPSSQKKATDTTEKSLKIANAVKLPEVSLLGMQDDATEKSGQGAAAADSVIGTDQDGTEKSLRSSASQSSLESASTEKSFAPEAPDPNKVELSLDAGDDPTDLSKNSGSLDTNKDTIIPKASSPTEVMARAADTGYAALLSDQETFIPEEGLGPPAPAQPSQGYPKVPGYEIVGTLGRGGMGVVYKAKHLGLRRLVALKMILHGDMASPSDLVRFRIEAQAIARLQHPNIVQIYEIGEFKGLPFFSLEYVDGGTLSRKIGGAPQPIGQAAQMIETLARTMAFAHQRHIVHRDLKPGNVLLTPDGAPKIVDFGLAKTLDEMSGQTHSGAIMGTPSYMAPEQADGRSNEIGPAADIYALGAILFDMLTGRPPFRAEKPMDTLRMVIEDEPLPPSRLNPKVPRDLETICLKCLQKRALGRYATALELADDLRRFQEGVPITARPVTRTERLLKWVRRRPALAAVYALLLVVTVLGSLGGILYWLWNEAVTSRRQIEAALGREQQALGSEAQAREKLQQLSYIHRINLAWRDWNDGEVMRARMLVNGCAESRRQWEWHYLLRRVSPELLTLPKGNDEWADEPAQVLFGPDGKPGALSRVLIVGKDKEVRERDASTGQEFPSLLEGRQVQYLAYSEGGRYLAAAGADHAVTLWSVAEGKVLHTLRGHKGPVVHLTFTVDGKRLASASWDKTAKVWDVLTGTELRTLKGHEKEVVWLAFSPDGRRLATASWDATAKIWEPATGKEIAVLEDHDDALTQVVYSPDGSRLATGCVDKTVKLWDAATFTELPPLQGPMEDINHLAFSPDGGRLAFAKRDKTIKVFDVFSGKQLFFLQGHVGEVTQVIYGPDGWRLVSAGKDKKVKVWDASTGKEGLTLHGTVDNVNFLAYGEGGRREVAVCLDNVVRVWDTNTGRELALCAGHSAEVTHLAYAPGGRTLATAAKDKTVKIWDRVTGKELHTLKGHAAEVMQVAYDPGGTRLISGDLDGSVKVWDPVAGLELFSLAMPGDVVQSAFRPDGGQLAVAARAPDVPVFDFVTGKKLFDLKGHKDAVLCLAYNPSGTVLATAGKDQLVKWWDAATGAERFSMAGHTGDVVHLAFSPDGRFLATASWDKTIKIWDGRSGELLATLEGHIGEVVQVAFSPDSARLASASWDRTVKLWDVATGKELLSLAGHPEEVTGVTFSPDGRQLASTSRGGIKIWESQGPETTEAWKERGHLWREDQAVAALENRRWFAAAFHLDQLVRHNPARNDWRGQRAVAYAELGMWDNALTDFNLLALRAPKDHELRSRQALVHLARQDQGAFRLACAALVQDFGKLEDVKVVQAVSGLVVLTSGLGKEYGVVRGPAFAAVQAAPENADHERLLGAVLYRTGAFAAALKHLSRAAELAGNDGTVETRLFLSLTHYQLKDADQAKTWLGKAALQMEKEARTSEGSAPLSWEEKVRRQALRREAEKALDH